MPSAQREPGSLADLLEGKPRDWENPHVLGRGRQAMHMPLGGYASQAEAETLGREASTYFESLNGLWKFHWCERPEEVPSDLFPQDHQVMSWVAGAGVELTKRRRGRPNRTTHPTTSRDLVGEDQRRRRVCKLPSTSRGVRSLTTAKNARDATMVKAAKTMDRAAA